MSFAQLLAEYDAVEIVASAVLLFILVLESMAGLAALAMIAASRRRH